MIRPYENLKKIRENKGISVRKMADLASTSPSQIVYLENGNRSLSLEWIEKFSNILQCNPADILGYEFLGIDSSKLTLQNNKEVSKDNNSSNLEYNDLPQHSIPVQSFSQNYACGTGAEPLNYEKSNTIYVDKSFLRNLSPNTNKIIMVKASGNSMEPLIKDKNIVFIDTAIFEIKNIRNPNHSVFAFRYEGSLCIKQLSYKDSSKQIIIASSCNKEEYEPFEIDLSNGDDFQIIGRVLSVYSKL